MSAPLTAAAVFEEHIQKSRFLARAWPIDSVESAMTHVADCEREEASHHCYAYRIGTASTNTNRTIAPPGFV